MNRAYLACMYRPRIIPCLLLKGKGLVKSAKFKNHRYIGDPLNAVRIFNDKKADELLFLDIEASKKGGRVSTEIVRKLGDECHMPFSVGGGIKTVADVGELISAGAEKVCINSAAIDNPELVKQASEIYGSSAIIVAIDVKKNMLGKHKVYRHANNKLTSLHPLAHALAMTEAGAGELFINSVDKDGTMGGYDLPLIRSISEVVPVPVIASGGAGSLDDLVEGLTAGRADALAAGSMFVFHGPRKAVLINMPARNIVSQSFSAIP